MNMNKLGIVVSRFRENIDWVNNLNDVDIHLYNKGDDNLNFLGKTINLPNLGRESDTFLNYIINNYDNLNEYSIFLQGDPFFHFNNLVYYINNKLYLNKKLDYIGHRIETDDIYGYPNHGGLRIKDVLDDMKMPYDLETKFTFSAGAQYLVHKELILTKSKEWWIKLYETHTKYLSIPGINGSPWIFERIWPYIWNYTE